jgi:hypothetical protein
MTDAEYRYIFHWGITAAGVLVLLLWGTALLLIENRSKKHSAKDS